MEEYRFEELISTQEYAKKLYKENKKDFIVLSDIQTNGHGRNGHSWISPKGGLWFSFDFNIKTESSLITLLIGVAVRDILSKNYEYEIQLKWPNDLILDRKKVGGILCEKIGSNILVGIGINTNVDNVDNSKAVTFFQKFDKKVNNHEIMLEIIEKCREMSKYSDKEIVEKFKENMAYLDELCFVTSLNKEAKILGVADNGRLIVETDEGKEEIVSGEVNLCI